MNEIELKNELELKYEKLKDYIRQLEKVAVAFSGGVDSTFLLMACFDAIGSNVSALTARASIFPKREMQEAMEFSKSKGIKHNFIDVDFTNISGFEDNPKNRCYICKKAIFGEMLDFLSKGNEAVLLEGSNLDDLSDYRPGLIAIKEMGIKSPLRELGFTKQEIRLISSKLNLETAEKPSFACLATRFPYGQKISKRKLSMIEKSEDLLYELGFAQFRVRCHDNIARIEVLTEDFHKIIDDDIRNLINKGFKEIGFDYVALDLSGYRTGSMNLDV